MKIIITIISLFCFFSFSCKLGMVEIKHVDELTFIDSVEVEGRKDLQINRYDYFILYGYNSGSKEDTALIKACVKAYADSFSQKYENYLMFFYKASHDADTNYIKSFEKKYAYKVLIHEKPIFQFSWWDKRPLLSPW